MRKKSWECKKLEVIRARVKHEEHQASVAELTELIYKYLCQLEKDHPLATETLTVPMHKSEVADAA